LEGAGERVRMAVHESAVNNSSALLEGRVRSLVDVLNGKFFTYVAESAEASERVDIRFHDAFALRTTLRDGAVELRLVGAAFMIDGSDYPGMEITLRYRLENEPSMVLRLSEPPRVAPHALEGEESQRVGLRGIALRRILANVLAKNVSDTIDLTEFSLPEPFAELGKLQTQRIAIEDGWFMVEALPNAMEQAEMPAGETSVIAEAN